MKTNSERHTRRFFRYLPLCAALGAAAPLSAQPASTSAPEASAPAAAVLRVGDATRSLWQRQRDGREASATPRPIEGATAELSRQRLQKSFEQPLPAWFDSRLQNNK